MTRTGARVVVNALAARIGGGPTYASNLLRGIAEVPELGLDVHVVATTEQRRALPPEGFSWIDGDWAGRSLARRIAWEAVVLPRILSELRPDVYYALSGTLGTRVPAGCRSVVAFRNLLPFSPRHRRLYPLGYTRARLALLRLTQARAMSRADLVIFVSSHGREVVDAVAPSRSGRSVVIPHGVDASFAAAADAGESKPRWPGGYVLYVSILDVYKAQIEVVEAWAALVAERDTPETLVLVGPEYRPYGRRVRRRIAELGLSDRVVVHGPAPRRELPALYRNATLNLFASRCENCPNILLEAMAAGRPVLCSQDPPMPEFAANAVVYFDPSQPRELAERMREVLDDDALQRDLGERASKRARDFPIGRFSRRTWTTISDLATGGEIA